MITCLGIDSALRPQALSGHCLSRRIQQATVLYVSHAHRDHFDDEFLRTLRKDIPVLLPENCFPKLKQDYRSREPTAHHPRACAINSLCSIPKGSGVHELYHGGDKGQL
jgi:hypothetical protein